MDENTRAKLDRWRRRVEEHRAEMAEMHDPDARASLRSIIASYDRLIALVERKG